ncbi:MAG: hypothetical protein AAGK71_11670 [Pseudomonadota bacterium]
MRKKPVCERLVEAYTIFVARSAGMFVKTRLFNVVRFVLCP